MKILQTLFLWLFNFYKFTFSTAIVFFAIFFISYKIANLLSGFTIPEYYEVRAEWFMWGICAYVHLLVLIQLGGDEDFDEYK